MDANDWNERYRGRELVWSAGPNRFLVDEVEALAPGTALDIACGEGRNALWLAERGWTVTAVDFSSVAVDKGREVAARRGVEVDWHVGDVRSWRAEGAFDLVIVFYLHLPWHDMARAVAGAAAAVAPGGTFLLVGHDLDNLERGHGGPQDAAVLYTPEQVAAALEDAGGFDVVRAERIEREVAARDDAPSHKRTGGTGAIAIDNLVRAIRRSERRS